MIKLSVKRPYLVFVGICMIIVLGIVAFTKMKTDLIPSIKVPYLAMVTTYPGASPERVEHDITDPIENTIGTLSGIENITSNSAENYSMIMLEFSEDSDMESAASRVARSVENLTLPELAGKPMIIEISSDMLATMYVGVTRDGADIYELTDYVRDEVVPELKRQDGVASVSTVGGVTQSVEIRLVQSKIDDINDKILQKVNKNLAEAQEELDKSKDQLADGKAKIEEGKSQLEASREETASEMAKLTKQLNEALALKAAYESQVSSLDASIRGLGVEKDAYQSAYDELNNTIKTLYKQMPMEGMPQDLDDAAENPEKVEALKQMLTAAGQSDAASKLSYEAIKQVYDGAHTRIPEIDAAIRNLNTEKATAEAVLKQIKKSVKEAEKNYEKVESGKMTAAAAFGSNEAQLTAAAEKLEESDAKIKEAEDTLKESAKTARENANLNALLNMDTLSKLLAAQNFDMPAGYISEDNTQYLLKVGDEFSELDELRELVLVKAPGVGDVKLSDVAEITYIDDSADNYARMNGNPAVVVSIMKASTAYTSEVSDNCNKAILDMSEADPTLHFLPVMDQGDYIDMIVRSVLQNLIFGAILAILVLMLFLRDPRPTLVIGFSIPLSVLFAVVLMYFSGITLNAISLSGLALGIGMLVDNSVVSIENIYRLRNEGVSPGRAAVEGAKQIAGAITASTLTTICVFLPMLFTEGITRELLMDMCLTITYSLVASLVVALTVVPSMSATLLRKTSEKSGKIYEAFQNMYESVLRFSLRFKIVPVAIAILLLAFSIFEVGKMGLVIFPDIASNQLSADFTFEVGTENEDCAAATDDILKQIAEVDGVSDVGAMASTGSVGLLGIDGLSTGSLRSMQVFVMLDKGREHENKRVSADIEDILSGYKLEDYSVSASNMDMTAMFGNGLSIDIKGTDTDQLLTVSEDIMKIVEDSNSFERIENGQEEGDKQIELTIDKNKAARAGLSVAQIFSELSEKLTTSTTSTTLHTTEKDYTVTIVDETDQLTYDNLMDYEIEVESTKSDGTVTKKKYKLSHFATKTEGKSLAVIKRENQERFITVTAQPKDGVNTTVASRSLQDKIDKYDAPAGVDIEIAGETASTNEVVNKMLQMMLLGFIFIYLIMVAQFQSLLSPFIVIFTVPLAFTGGLVGLLISGQQLSLLSLMGFLILMGVIVNNGIVYVDFVNQLRLDGTERQDALVEAGRKRMRPILMTALTTILAMCTMIFSSDMGSDMGRGMAIVVVGGLIYATLMTLIIIPVLYDLMYKKPVTEVIIDD